MRCAVPVCTAAPSWTVSFFVSVATLRVGAVPTPGPPLAATKPSCEPWKKRPVAARPEHHSYSARRISGVWSCARSRACRSPARPVQRPMGARPPAPTVPRSRRKTRRSERSPLALLRPPGGSNRRR
eukprot:7089805-Pyramimonas_sp.AAC.1